MGTSSARSRSRLHRLVGLRICRHGAGIDAVEHQIVKPPVAWRGSLAETLCDLDSLTEPKAFFSSSASETASQFSKNANVAMTTALAGIGPDDTKITLIADPTSTTNRHEITAHGAFGQLSVVPRLEVLFNCWSA